MTSPEALAQLLAQAPRDCWIALSEDESRVVATGTTMEMAVEAAALAGVPDPVLLKSPKEWGPAAL